MAIVILPVIILGLILAILEIVFVYQDEGSMHPLTHAMHALPAMFIFIFISMNVSFVLGLFNMQTNLWLTIGIRVIVGIIAMAKIAGAVAVAGPVGEKLPHTLIIGALIIAAPFIWESLVCLIPFVQNFGTTWNGCPAA